MTKASAKFASRRKKLKELGEFAPKFTIAFDLGFLQTQEHFLSLPFKRSVPAILISGVFLTVFTIPLLSVGSFALGETPDNLFSLVSIFFSLFWVLGWSTGVLILAPIFLMVTFGRETLKIRKEELVLRIGLPGLAVGMKFPSEALRYFRRNKADVITGTSWRSDHLCFDYAGEQINFGSAIGPEKAESILKILEEAFPHHKNPPLEFTQVSSTAKREDNEDQISSAVRHTPPAGVEVRSTSWTSISSLALILANLVPLIGVLVLSWRIGEILLLFWAESAVIGFYNLCKMWRIGRWSILFYGPFFVGHYGAFMVGHLLFIYGFFGSELTANGELPAVSQVGADFLAMAPALLVFFLSHGVSYFVNFIGRKEFLQRSTGSQMQEPYKRILIMHFTILIGGFMVMVLSSPLPALLLLLLLKLTTDLRAHIKEHSN